MATALSRRLGKRSLLGTRVAAPDRIPGFAPHEDGAPGFPNPGSPNPEFPNPGSFRRLHGQQAFLTSLDEQIQGFPAFLRERDALQAPPGSGVPERSVSGSIDVPKRRSLGPAAVEMDEMVAALVLTSLSCGEPPPWDPCSDTGDTSDSGSSSSGHWSSATSVTASPPCGSVTASPPHGSVADVTNVSNVTDVTDDGTDGTMSPPHGGVTVSPPYGGVTVSPPHGGVTMSPPYGGVTVSPPHGGVTTSPPYGSVTLSSPHSGGTDDVTDDVTDDGTDVTDDGTDGTASPPYGGVTTSPPYGGVTDDVTGITDDITDGVTAVPGVTASPPTDDGFDTDPERFRPEEPARRRRKGAALFACLWPGCGKALRSGVGIKRHIRTRHLRETSDHEEDFYYTELQLAPEPLAVTGATAPVTSATAPVTGATAPVTAATVPVPVTVPVAAVTGATASCSAPIVIPGQPGLRHSGPGTFWHIQADHAYQALPSIQIPVSPHIFTSISWAAATATLPSLSPARGRSLSLSEPRAPPLLQPQLLAASPPRLSLSARKIRGEAKKCRKVYGIEHREQWCTACRWKKACQRFLD